jgi:hemerythrin-like metal-binding protein
MNLPQLPLGVAVMDEDHYTLEQMFARTPLIGNVDLSAHLDAIIAALRAHFTREEAAMEAEAVPILSCHRGQHAALLQEADRLREAFAFADAPMRRQVIGFGLARLVADHIASVDAISSNFFAHKINYAQDSTERELA